MSVRLLQGLRTNHSLDVMWVHVNYFLWPFSSSASDLLECGCESVCTLSSGRHHSCHYPSSSIWCFLEHTVVNWELQIIVSIHSSIIIYTVQAALCRVRVICWSLRRKTTSFLHKDTETYIYWKTKYSHLGPKLWLNTSKCYIHDWFLLKWILFFYLCKVQIPQRTTQIETEVKSSDWACSSVLLSVMKYNLEERDSCCHSSGYFLYTAIDGFISVRICISPSRPLFPIFWLFSEPVNQH